MVSLQNFDKNVYLFAYMFVKMCIQNPLFTDILLSLLYKKSFFCIPAYNIKQEYNDIEKDSIIAYVAFYAAFVQNSEEKNPHGIKYGLTWIVALLDVQPQLYAIIALYTFLRIAGYRMNQKYGKQFEKIILLIKENYLSLFKKKYEKNDYYSNLNLYISYVENFSTDDLKDDPDILIKNELNNYIIPQPVIIYDDDKTYV